MDSNKKNSQSKLSESVLETLQYKISYPGIIALFIIFFLISPVIGLLKEQKNFTKLTVFSRDNPVIDISGGWEYTWGLDSTHTQEYLPGVHEKIPGSEWKSINYPVNPPGRDGRNILWLRRSMPPGEWKDPALIISPDGIKHTFRVFLDDRKIYDFGGMNSHGDKCFYGISSHLVPLGDNSKEKTLTLMVLSSYSNIGVQGKILFGSSRDLVKESVINDFDTIAICIAIMLIGFLDIFSFKENPHRKGPLSLFGILAISLGTYLITLTTIKDIIFFSPLFWFNLYIVSATILPVGLLGFVWQTFRPDHGSFLHRLWQAHIGYSVICQVSFLLAFYSLLPVSIGFWLLTGLKYLGIIEELFVLGIILNEALIKKKEEAWIYLLGIVPITLFAIHDTFVQLGKIEPSNSYVPYGLLIFILSLEFIRRHQFIKEKKQLITYAKQLEINALEKEELLQDLHDGLGGPVTNIKFLAQMAMNNSSIQEVKEILQTISELSRDSLMEISSFMQTLDDDEINWQVIQTKFQRYGIKLLKPHGITFRLETNIGENIQKPKRILFLNLWRIYEEALTNITKHSKTKKVIVELNIESDKLFLSIKDYGIGLEKKSNNGRGLSNMETRAIKIGGSLTISSKEGTCVALELPMSQVAS
jgi:signal transduction histidine kinase